MYFNVYDTPSININTGNMIVNKGRESRYLHQIFDLSASWTVNNIDNHYIDAIKRATGIGTKVYLLTINICVVIYRKVPKQWKI